MLCLHNLSLITDRIKYSTVLLIKEGSSFFYCQNLPSLVVDIQSSVTRERNRESVFIYMRPGRNAWCLVSGWNDIFCVINISLTQKHAGMQFLDPV